MLNTKKRMTTNPEQLFFTSGRECLTLSKAQAQLCAVKEVANLAHFYRTGQDAVAEAKIKAYASDESPNGELIWYYICQIVSNHTIETIVADVFAAA